MREGEIAEVRAASDPTNLQAALDEAMDLLDPSRTVVNGDEGARDLVRRT